MLGSEYAQTLDIRYKSYRSSPRNINSATSKPLNYSGLIKIRNCSTWCDASRRRGLCFTQDIDIALPREPRILFFVMPLIFITATTVISDTAVQTPQLFIRFYCACSFRYHIPNRSTQNSTAGTNLPVLPWRELYTAGETPLPVFNVLDKSRIRGTRAYRSPLNSYILCCRARRAEKYVNRSISDRRTQKRHFPSHLLASKIKLSVYASQKIFLKKHVFIQCNNKQFIYILDSTYRFTKPLATSLSCLSCQRDLICFITLSTSPKKSLILILKKFFFESIKM